MADCGSERVYQADKGDYKWTAKELEQRFNKDELKVLCGTRGQLVSGNKPELIARLLTHWKAVANQRSRAQLDVYRPAPRPLQAVPNPQTARPAQSREAEQVEIHEREETKEDVFGNRHVVVERVIKRKAAKQSHS